LIRAHGAGGLWWLAGFVIRCGAGVSGVFPPFAPLPDVIQSGYFRWCLSAKRITDKHSDRRLDQFEPLRKAFAQTPITEPLMRHRGHPGITFLLHRRGPGGHLHSGRPARAFEQRRQRVGERGPLFRKRRTIKTLKIFGNRSSPPHDINPNPARPRSFSSVPHTTPTAYDTARHPRKPAAQKLPKTVTAPHNILRCTADFSSFPGRASNHPATNRQARREGPGIRTSRHTPMPSQVSNLSR
jgi:hypothetical protein